MGDLEDGSLFLRGSQEKGERVKVCSGCASQVYDNVRRDGAYRLCVQPGKKSVKAAQTIVIATEGEKVGKPSSSSSLPPLTLSLPHPLHSLETHLPLSSSPRWPVLAPPLARRFPPRPPPRLLDRSRQQLTPPIYRASPSPPDSKDTSVTSTLTRPSSPLTARTRPPLPDRLPTQVPHSPDLIPLTNGLGLVDLNRDASGSKLPAPAVAGPPPFDSRPRPVQGFQASFSPTVYFPFPPAPHGHYPLSRYCGEETSPPSQPQQPFYPSYPPSSQDGQNGYYPHSQFSVDMRYRYTQFSPYGPQPHPYVMAPPPYSDAPSSSPYPISSCRPAVSSSHRPPPASMPSGLPPHQPRLQGSRRIPLTLKDKLERGSVTSSGICKFFDPAKVRRLPSNFTL